jgi:UDP-glucose 4-epimerase
VRGVPRRILVTGASGFVGTAVVNQLVTQDRDIAVLLRNSTDPRQRNSIPDWVTVIKGDLLDLNPVADQISSFAPEAVIHLAWGGVSGAERNNPAQTANVFASLDLYRAAAEAGMFRFVGLGSQAEYGPCPARVDETVPSRPTTVYGAAKLATFHLLDRIAATEGISFGWLRLFSAYGPADDPERLVPHVILRLLAGLSPSLTRCEQMWDYIYVDDVAAAIVAAVDSDSRGAFNLGAGQAYRLVDIVTRIRDMIDGSPPLRFGAMPYRPDQVMHLEADIARLTAASGWAPKVSIEDGLSRTVKWFREWREAND